MKNNIYHDGSWTIEELKKFLSGKFIDRNGKRYGMCQDCRKIIRLDKVIFGSIHVCEKE